MRATSLRGKLGSTRDRNSWPHVATGLGLGLGDQVATGGSLSRQGSLGSKSPPWTVSRPKMDKARRLVSRQGTNPPLSR